MKPALTAPAAWLVLLALAPLARSQPAHPYKYFRAGNPADAPAARTRPGYALMGGGSDLDPAFRFLCDRSGGGDFLILRARGDDDYNPYIQKICKQNSVATLILG